jgi:membrane fusion protein (multidrug efflux system)
MRHSLVTDMKLKNIATATTASLLFISVTGCGVGEAKTKTEESVASAPLPVEVVSPRKAEILATYHATANIASDVDAQVTARVNGETTEILVEEGDQVKAGQLLARLDGERLRLEMQQAKANLDKTTREYERFINLHDRGLVSSTTFDGMKFDMDSLQASFELKQLNYNYTFIRAPISGVVSARNIKIGQHVNAGDPTFRITDTSDLIAYLEIPQSELAKFSADHDADVRVDAMPGQSFKATIVRISPTIDARSGTFRVTARIDNQNGDLAPGMFGRFEIAYEKHADAMLIPADAVLQEDNVSVVYIADDGEAVRRTIKTGIVKDGNIEVLSGLDGSERIIVTGQNGLRDGSKVLASVSSRMAAG